MHPRLKAEGSKSVTAGSVVTPQNYVSGYEGVYPWRTTSNTIEGMMDGEWTNPPLTFVLRDRSEPAASKVEHLSITSRDSISVDLRSGGGFVARIKR